MKISLIIVILLIIPLASTLPNEAENRIDFFYVDTSATYYPSSYSILTGTPSGGNNLGNLSYYDGQTFNLTEAVGSPALELRVNFTNLTTVNALLMRGQFVDGSADLLIQLWDYNLGSWQNYRVVNSESALTVSNTPILDPEEHIQNGTLQLRAYVSSSGNPTYYYIIDFIQLQKGTTSITSNEHDSLSGRNDLCINHPWVCTLTNALDVRVDNVNSSLTDYTKFSDFNSSELETQ